MFIKTEYDNVRPYTTKDGSLIREFMHPEIQGNRRQSIAEAIVAPGSSTILHKHHKSEEIYHIIEGVGVMTLGNEETEIRTGDTLCIPPGTEHRVKNTGEKPLKILCCCSPAYSHDDTVFAGSSLEKPKP